MTSQLSAQRDGEFKTDLDTAYPDKTIDVGEGLRVGVRPIPLRSLGRVLSLLVKLAQLVESGQTIGDIIPALGDDLMVLIEKSLVDTDIDDLSIAAAPAILEYIIAENLKGDALKNWSGLLEKLMKHVPQEAKPQPRKRQKN